MKNWIAALLPLGLLLTDSASAQYESFHQEGELGIAVGAAHYFGDLNTRGRLNRPKPAIGVFFRKQFNNYVALRIAANFAQLGYSDIYNTQNEYQHRRNLSFNTNIFELSLQGDFNFFKFVPGDPDHGFTPYVTLGAGAFNFDPYAFLGGKKYYLRPLGTEGQGTAAYPDRKPYNSMAFCFPFGVGVKYTYNYRINIGAEVVYRFTTTDYLDDVSKTYVGADKFPGIPQPDGTLAPSPAQLLQDRSYETGDLIGIEGRQRGLPNQKDAYVMAQLFVSFNLTSYRCPSAN